MLPWHQYLLGLLFVIAGANHFRTPKIYERIMPLYIPSPSFMVLLSGTVSYTHLTLPTTPYV